MFDEFFDSICRVGIFVMCAQTIVHFKPKEVYEKYLRYLVSVMVLIQLFLPISGFLLGGGNTAIHKALKQFEEDLKSSMELAEENAKQVDEKLEAMTLEEVRKQMEQQTNDSSVPKQSGGIIESNVTDIAVAEEHNVTVEIEEIEPIIVGN